MTATTTTSTIDAEMAAHAPAEHEVATWRLNALRLVYLLMALFLLSAVAPLLTNPAPTHMTSVARALLVGLGIIALFGLRYPLQMLPLMLFEIAWKGVWLAFYGIPGWMAGAMEPAYAASLKDTGIGVVLAIVVVPWKYVFDHYVAARGERWR